MIKKTKEDYLRAIYHLWEDKKDPQEGINSVSLSDYLGISKPTVSEMLRKLMKEELIHMSRYGKINLTKKGLSESKAITRKHRIIETFLTKTLKLSPRSIHEEAHRLEHAFSDDSINSICKLIKDIKHCPHGKLIP